jgi:hypothetical protein
LPSKYFFSYKSLNARKGKIQVPTSYLQDSPSSFFCPTAQVKKAKDYFLRQATYKGTYVEAVESARAGLSPKKGGREKGKKKTKEGEKVAPRRQGSVCPQPRISFFGSRVFGFWETRLI